MLTFWRLLSGAADPIPMQLRAMQRLFDESRGPIVWMSLTDPEVVDLDFLQRATERVSVLSIGYDWNAPESGASVAPSTHADFCNPLLHAWPECITPAQAADDATVVQLPAPVLRIVGAAHSEGEAVFAAYTLVGWLNAGRRSLALVTQDRIVARRVHALLACVDVPVRGETG